MLAHSTGAPESILDPLENYLPAHYLCNNYRWDYSQEEIQWILKIGVWARTRMQGNRSLDRKMRDAFYRDDRKRYGHRSKTPRPT